jgi:hypothetical protein
MKYRTDFVTNSSSSSFTIHIALETVDGCTICYENTGSEEAGYDVELYVSPRQMGRAESIDALIALLQGEGTNDGFWEEPPPWEYPEDDEEDFCDEDEVCNADSVSGESGNSGEEETSDADEAGKADEPSGEDTVAGEADELSGEGETSDADETEEADEFSDEDEIAGEAVESSVEEETSDAGATEVADEFSDEDEITAAEAFIEQLLELGSMDRIKSITVTGHEGGWLSANHFQQYVYDRVSGRYSGRVWGKPNPKGQAGCLRFSDVDECGME